MQHSTVSSGSSENNRRVSARRTVRMPCEAVRERDFSLVGNVVLDLSSTGALLRSSAKVLTGDSMILSFFEPEAARWFDVEATVARVVHGRRLGDGGRAVGVRFSAMAAQDKRALERALNKRVPSLPKRRKVS
jgi:c-di-GMP-binding flagellar brake protein YcgR